ncbi:hypothetical protein J1TS3_21190 [Siminovitchia fordii]|uniref:Uncharacterized protein n=2 Tax=Siminovitchia fordii TaxID=254759 RepID=A0ABQ4K731_9BACI|nr:hypothetical protein J1TS3_21190 [Siminovitchia fordii]
MGPTGPNFAEIGFSAQRAPTTLSASGQLGNWTVTSPYYSGTGFNPTTGNYTIQQSGRYSIKAVISYTTTAAITATLGAGVNPSLIVRRTSPVQTDLISGLFPVLNVNVALVLTLRAVLGNGTVTLAGDVYLNAGDNIGLFYEANGLTIGLNIGGTAPSGTIWSVHKLTD